MQVQKGTTQSEQARIIHSMNATLALLVFCVKLTDTVAEARPYQASESEMHALQSGDDQVAEFVHLSPDDPMACGRKARVGGAHQEWQWYPPYEKLGAEHAPTSRATIGKAKALDATGGHWESVRNGIYTCRLSFKSPP